MKKILLLTLSLLTFIIVQAETWTPVGQAQWTEGALTAYNKSYNKTWNVPVERSDSRPQVYRLQPYASHPLSLYGNNVYVILHMENPQSIYIENYKVCENGSLWYYWVFQRCPENGFDSKYYGTITDANTIEFPVASFAVELTNEQIDTPSDFAKNSTAVHKIVFPDGILDYTPVVDNWVYIGQGHCTAPFPTGGMNVNIEKSTQSPHTFRFTCSHFADNDYVKINTENPDKVYITPYNTTKTDGTGITITQNCTENRLSGSKYGTLINGKILIPGDSFVATLTADGSQANVTFTDCEIILPDGFDNPLPEDNGIFMGIIGFNDEISRQPISLLNEETKKDFTSFVDELQMGNATLLYYAVDQAISSMKAQSFPDNLSNAILVTFTDGLDQGSLAMKPEHRTSRGYASYLSDLIANTSIQEHPIEAYAIGLKSDDVYDDELFMFNLQSLASNENNISSVNNIAELQQKLTELLENLNKQTTQRVVTIKVPMMSHGDKYRFTLDHSRTSATNSEIWFEGTFNIDNLSLEDITYHGFTSTSGLSLNAKQEGIKLIFTLNDCRDLDGGILSVDQDGIDQWQYITSRDIWNHNVENAKAEDIDIQNIKSSVAIMFALDCSMSLGDLFPLVKSTANSFIERLAGSNNETALDNIIINSNTIIDINTPGVEIYNLQGTKVQNPGPGIYIVRATLPDGTTATAKTLLR